MWPFTRKSNPFDDVLKAQLDADFKVFGAGDDAPKEKDLDEFEKSFGCALPSDFRKYSCSRIGGIYVEAKESVWPRPEKFEVAPFWSFLYGLHVYAFAPNCPDWMSIRLQTEQFRRDTNSLFIPCLKIRMDANIYCFDRQGQLCRWDHDVGEASKQNKSFSEIFAFEIAELRKRKDKKKTAIKAE